ncbi:uncharacterized protein LOC135148552 [Daucus carota subsp. sativus]|uniref:uncharacterized protein LOC135148552 n=1 Tax=Daucus carota subsp. sativus TaxID=79200 RepID=UPI003083B4F7
MEEKKRSLILAQVVVGEKRSDYYVFDLEADEVLKTEIQSLLDQGQGDMVKLGGMMYNIGGLRRIDECPPLDVIPCAEGDHHVHLGVSCLDLKNFDDAPLSSNKWRWNDIPPMKEFRIYPSCASLDGKLYAFYCLSAKTHIGEVFDPSLGRWEPLPPPPEEIPAGGSLLVSPRVISDEKRHRILVHFDTTHSLYAYYPDFHSWDCLVQYFSPWYPATIALVDDVLFFHIYERRDCLAAFDLLSNSWLKVKYSSNFPAWDMSFNEWQNILHLGDGILCLANSCASLVPPLSTLIFGLSN